MIPGTGRQERQKMSRDWKLLIVAVVLVIITGIIGGLGLAA